jgi:hypothetical protein
MNGRTLDSWKEIAGFLQRDIKTCQRWEKERGLPVHRLDGLKRSRVSANPEELAAWRQKNDIVASAKGADAPPDRKSAITRFVVIGIMAIIFIAAALHFGVFAPLFSKAKKHAEDVAANPADFHIAGTSLVVVNAAGSELWRFDTRNEKLASEETYRNQMLEDERYAQAALPYLIIKDINHDGFAEVIFSTQTTDNFDEGELYVFDHKGTPLWDKMKVGGRHRFGAVEFSADYRIEGMAAVDLDGDGNLELILMTAHMPEWPSQLIVIKADGRILGDYWNAGRFTCLGFADIDGDGTKEILAAGTNNEYGKACLIVLDPRNMHGGSPQTEDEFKCPDFPKGTEEYYLLFPRTDVDLIESFPREAMDRIDLPENRVIRVMPRISRMYFELDYSLAVLRAKSTYDFEIKHEKLLREGKIQSRLDGAYFETLKNGVLYWDGRAWVAHLAASHEEARGSN